jgi:hypothetical protein
MAGTGRPLFFISGITSAASGLPPHQPICSNWCSLFPLNVRIFDIKDYLREWNARKDQNFFCQMAWGCRHQQRRHVHRWRAVGSAAILGDGMPTWSMHQRNFASCMHKNMPPFASCMHKNMSPPTMTAGPTTLWIFMCQATCRRCWWRHRLAARWSFMSKIPQCPTLSPQFPREMATHKTDGGIWVVHSFHL